MAKVHGINSRQTNKTVDYKHHAIQIVYREETKDFVYNFTHTKTLNFDGHGSTYDNCLSKAKRYVDVVTGG